jgi:hypothetical protein
MSRKILNKPVATDDFGDLVYVCRFTKKYVRSSDSIFLGEVSPQVSGSYVCATDANAARIESAKGFATVDRNCNTCKHLQRNAHPKQHPAAMHTGVCGVTGKPLIFHPEDYMGMPCWVPRD